MNLTTLSLLVLSAAATANPGPADETVESAVNRPAITATASSPVAGESRRERRIRRRHERLASRPPIEQWRLWARQSLAEDSEAADLIGDRRMKELAEARFHLHRAALDPGRELEDDPHSLHRVEDILRSNFLKLSREYLERQMEIDILLSRHKQKRRLARAQREDEDGGARLRLSPRLRGGSNPALGVKLNLRGATLPFLSATSLELRQYMDSGETLLRLKYAHAGRLIQLEHQRGNLEHGDTYALSFSFSF